MSNQGFSICYKLPKHAHFTFDASIFNAWYSQWLGINLTRITIAHLSDYIWDELFSRLIKKPKIFKCTNFD